MKDVLSLEGRRTILTGAAGGLGQAIARAFAAAGADLLLCGRDSRKLRALAEELAGSSKRPSVFVGDLSIETNVSKLFDQAMDSLGGVDVLVNNAATQGPIGPLIEVDWPTWRSTLFTDLLAPVLLMRLALTEMIKVRSGKIINISGGGATKPMRGFSAYSAAKAGLVRLSETLAQEVAAQKIDINCVAPGALNTAMLDEVLGAGPAAVGLEYYEAAVARSTAGGSHPERAAKLCVFLASKASDGLTGKLISAIWDPWEGFAGHGAELSQSELYTLRRVAPPETECR